VTVVAPATTPAPVPPSRRLAAAQTDPAVTRPKRESDEGSRLLLLGVLALIAVIASWRQRSDEQARTTPPRARPHADASRAATRHTRKCSGPCRRSVAALRREDTVEQDLAVAGDRTGLSAGHDRSRLLEIPATRPCCPCCAWWSAAWRLGWTHLSELDELHMAVEELLRPPTTPKARHAIVSR